MMNAPTRREQLLHGKKRRMKKIEKFESQYGDLPELCITIYEVSFTYDTKMQTKLCQAEEEGTDEESMSDPRFGGTDLVLRDLRMQIDAGTVVCVQGHGKSTLLKLLARQLLPTTGFIMYPPRWRVRLCETPDLLNASLLENLTFGSNFAHPRTEIWGLCRMMGLSPKLIGKPYFQVGQRGEKLSRSDCVTITLVRALLSGVDLLLIGTLLDSLKDDHVHKIMTTFREFVRIRGCSALKTDLTRIPLHLRKLKTVVLCSRSPMITSFSDGSIILDRIQPTLADPPLYKAAEAPPLDVRTKHSSFGMWLVEGQQKEAEESEKDVIEFSGVEYLATEEEEFVMVTIVRRGLGTEKISVSWSVENESMGKTVFIPQSGSITMRVGVFAEDVKIHFGNDEFWSTEGRLQVKLAGADQCDDVLMHASMHARRHGCLYAILHIHLHI